MKCTVAVIFYSFAYVTYSFLYVNAAFVDTVDPESLFDHFKNHADLRRSAHQMDGKAEELPAGLSYFTPITEQLINNGTLTRDVILDYYNAMTDNQKLQLYDVESQLRTCWIETRHFSQSSQNTDLSCFFNPTTGKQCQSKYPSVVKGATQMKMIKCLSQKVTGLSELLGESSGRSKKSTASKNIGMSIEYGFGFAFGLYVSGSTGVAFGLSDKTNNLITATYCYGFKLDISAGGGVSVNYFSDMDDIPGEAVTVEFGFDVPTTEIGIDFLLHYNHDTKKVIGFGFSFGIGVGLNSFDVASSLCKTKVLAHYKSSVLIAIGPYSGWKCKPSLVGVVSDDSYICCPEDNPDKECTKYCWFDGKECPHSPKELAQITLEVGNVILRSFCPGQTYIAVAGFSYEKCERLWLNDYRQKYMVWRYSPPECWFSETYSIDACSWAPTSRGRIFVRP